MTPKNTRVAGESFTPLENTLLAILCSGTDTASSIARSQLTEATWGGYEHDSCDCFLISVTPAANAQGIMHDGGPFSVAEVSNGETTHGLLELWVVDERLHSVNYMPFGDDHVELPSPEDYTITLIENE